MDHHYHSDKVVVCPYNKSHLITTSRLQKHLVKCEKQYPAGFLSICPYNATHRMSKVKMQDHILNCPEKSLIKSVAEISNIPYETNVNLLVGENDENWDIKNDSPSFLIVKDDTDLQASCKDKTLDVRIPNWVEQTVRFRNKNVDSMSVISASDEVDVNDSVSQISVIYK